MPFIPFFLQTAEAGSSDMAGAMGGSFGMLIPLILVFIIMYFFMIRPQSKKQKETEKMIAALKKGDKVVTIGGIHGTVSSTRENTVVLKVEDGTKIEFNRTAISTVVTDKPAAAPAADSGSKKKGLFGKKEPEAVAAAVKEPEEPTVVDTEAQSNE